MKKVLVISPFYNGLYKYTKPLYDELVKNYNEEFEFKHIGNPNMTFDIEEINKEVNRLCDLVIEYNPDIIHYNYGTYDIEQLIPLELQKRGFKAFEILTYHSLQLDIFKKIEILDLDSAVNKKVGEMDGYVFFTNYAKKQFVERYNYEPANYVIAFHPATHKENHLTEEETKKYDLEFNIKRDKPIATVLGYPSHWKSSVPVIKLVNHFKDVNFVIAGPWWIEKIEKENPGIKLDELDNLIVINKELDTDEFNYGMDLGVGIFPYEYFRSFQGSGQLPNYLYRGINTLVNDFEPLKEYKNDVVDFKDEETLFNEFEKVINNRYVDKDNRFSYEKHAERIINLYRGDLIMKILFVHKDINQDINSGGINTVYLKHIENLSKTNNELFAITSRDGKWDLNCKRIIVSKDKDIRIKEIEEAIKGIDPDIIDVFSWGAELLEYVKKPHRAKVIMRADIPMRYYGLAPLDEEMAKNSDVVVSISNWCDSYWSSVIGEKTIVIPHGCDQSNIKTFNKIKNNVVWVGKSTDVKGFDLLFKLPDEFFKEFNLTVICAKTVFTDLEIYNKLIEKGANIVEHLSDKEYFKLMNESEFVLSTARKEGFCIAVLEAMNHGCIPVIPYWIGGTLDFVTNDNGIIYKSLDECFNLMKNEKNTKLKSKKAIIETYKFNWEDISLMSLNLYEELYNE